MKKPAAFAALLLSLLIPAATLFAAEHDDADKRDEKSEAAKAAAKEKVEAAAEKVVVTAHNLSLGGRTIGYKATAGTMLIRDDKGKPDASMFYVAYTADGESSKRPVTFLYNGGPGSASIWLHMGSYGPVRIVTSSPDPTAPAPYQVVPNPDSLLDKSDLVFVDAIGTGYSKGLVKETRTTIRTSASGAPTRTSTRSGVSSRATLPSTNAGTRRSSCSANRTARRARPGWRSISRNTASR